MSDILQKYDWLGGSLRLNQLDSGSLLVGAATWSVGQVHMVHETTSLKVETSGFSPSGTLVVLLSGSDRSCRINSQLISPNQMVLLCPGNEVRMITEPDHSMLALQIPVPMISAQFRLSELEDVGGFDFSRSRVITAAEGVDYFRRLIMNSRFEGKEGEWPHVWEQKLASQLKNLIMDNSKEWNRRPDARTVRKVEIFQRLDRYLETHSREKISMSDLTGVASVSERTLERMFKTEFGITPSAYITVVRLHKAMSDLAVNESPDKSIAQIAIDQGFEHLGRFSNTYREHFGQTPSAYRRALS